jgi:hypothetical protein
MVVFLLVAAMAAFAGIAFLQMYQRESRPDGDKASASMGLVTGVVMLVVACALVLKAMGG